MWWLFITPHGHQAISVWHCIRMCQILFFSPITISFLLPTNSSSITHNSAHLTLINHKPAHSNKYNPSRRLQKCQRVQHTKGRGWEREAQLHQVWHKPLCTMPLTTPIPFYTENDGRATPNDSDSACVMLNPAPGWGSTFIVIATFVGLWRTFFTREHKEFKPLRGSIHAWWGMCETHWTDAWTPKQYTHSCQRKVLTAIYGSHQPCGSCYPSCMGVLTGSTRDHSINTQQESSHSCLFSANARITSASTLNKNIYSLWASVTFSKLSPTSTAITSTIYFPTSSPSSFYPPTIPIQQACLPYPYSKLMQPYVYSQSPNSALSNPHIPLPYQYHPSYPPYTPPLA